MPYLTRGERERLHITFYFPDFLRDWMEDNRCTLTKEQRRKMKAAATYIENACVDFVEKLEPEYVLPLKRDVENYGLAMVAKRVTTFPEEVRINREPFYDIIDRAMAHSCTKQADGKACEGAGKPYKKCGLYKAFIDSNAPVYDPERKKECPYLIK